MTKHSRCLMTVLVTLLGWLPHYLQAVDLPEGFSESAVATDIQNPVGMEISPDGRLFVLAGNVRRIEIFDDSGFLNEFIRLPQVLNRGSGLLGLEFSPDFEQSGKVYIAYITDPADVPGPQRFRLSSFESDGVIADPDSELVLFEVEDIDASQQQHQGGDLAVGADGKIYWALGDRVEGSRVSQSLESLFGKVLRLNIDGSIPADNPYYLELEGELKAIYASGLRNPFRLDQRPSTGEIFMSEVGPQDWEELNRIESGANYGWPIVSGVVDNPLYTDPAHAYPHEPDGCAITGGSFYEPQSGQFPPQYHDTFFYGDHCFGWIAYVDLETGIDTRFLTGADRLVEVKVNPSNGAVYYLDRNYAGDTVQRTGGIGRIDFVGGNVSLDITRQPVSESVAVGESVTFSVLATGDLPLMFQWLRNGVEVSGETQSVFSIPEVSAEDNGTLVQVKVTDRNGFFLISEAATLTVTGNRAPRVAITSPEPALRYIAGQEYAFSGSAFDDEDGELDPEAFEWEIVFHHDDHTHPFIPELNGVVEGTFVPPVNDETDANVWYRIHLSVTDSDGASATTFHDVFPLTSSLSIRTEPPGLEVLLDGTPRNAPIDFVGVAGVARDIEAVATQVHEGQTWVFDSWSNGGDRSQTISTPIEDTSYVARYAISEDEPPETENTLPVPTIVTPDLLSGFSIGDEVAFSGIATDSEDGDLPESAFEWEVILHHGDDHTHVFSQTVGVSRGAFTPSIESHTEVNIWYRIHLTVTDSSGGSATVSRDVFPIVSTIRLETLPQNLELFVDGTLQSSPVELDSVSGVELSIEAPGQQALENQEWIFDGWSNQATRAQNFVTPSTDVTLLATYTLDQPTVDTLPVVELINPANNASTTAPVTVSGVASDDSAVRRVELAIRDRDTSRYWNGSELVAGYRTVDAVLISPNTTETSWSYQFEPPSGSNLRVVARARQEDGSGGDKVRVDFTVQDTDLPPIQEPVDVRSPEHQSTVSNPLLIEGSVSIDNLVEVNILIKEVGARNYWNGTAWQSGRDEFPVLVQDGSWAYELNQPEPRDVVIRAIAVDSAGNRHFSERVTARFE